MISFEPSADELTLKDAVHRFAADKMRPALRAAEEEGVADRLADELRALGLGLMTLPASVGGAALGARAIAVIEEELAWGDPGMAAAFPRPGLAGHVVASLDESKRDHWLARFVSGDARAAGVGVVGHGVAARAQGDTVILNGACTLAAPSDDADWTLIAAELDGQPALIAIERGTAGATFTPDGYRLGLRAATGGLLELNDCRVPRAAMLANGAVADDALRHGMELELVTQAAWAVGTSRAAFEYAGRYATERHTFGRPIAEHQAVAFMVADMGIEVEAARGLLWHAAWALDAKDQSATDLVRSAALAAGESSVRVTSDAVQILGGHGYIQDHPVEKWMRDARTLANLINSIAAAFGNSPAPSA